MDLDGTDGVDEVVRGRVPRPGGFDDVVVAISGGVVSDVRAALADDPEPAGILLPGLVDIHNHGGGGASFHSTSAEEIAVAAGVHHAAGTTTLLASTVTDAPERLLEVVAALATAAEDSLIAGIHLEGPFLEHSCRGAHDPDLLLAPDAGLTRELVAAARGHLRVMTLAAELPGAVEVAEVLAEAGAVVALGHTAATAAQARTFLDGPGSLVTHLFNGMPPAHHRDPGPVLGSLGAAGVGSACVELIADGVHLADETVRSVMSMVPGSVVLVTDAMAAAGMADGDYQLGPLSVEVRSGVARVADGTGSGPIAGGTSRLIDQVRRHAAAGIDLALLMRAASLRPASVVGLDAGRLEPGVRADLVVTDESLQPTRVMRGGEWLTAHPGLVS
ncbi:N-acetylglucosamine-6-phosphate deacetylase [Nocardioides luteus]|uniref:N-acetylglucosamine-6-phosphate deacetylase n=1 Tax=Nocardioides luteus TaxID=1844 RepID=A0ABQ5T3P2_9ACTN|nr:amidohydrolase family protein [Nocardioides luteus]GGR64253.1 N-acetylglucosamine-6-phosphate deacetylase [Nocardioides luteus]GLJ70503.1 N-acetylglucosamine-6-phosphate deacetylase [Nocardioides luteus]